MLLWGLYHFCPLVCPSLDEMLLWFSSFLDEISNCSLLLFSSISVYCSLKKAFLPLLFSGTLHLVGCNCPFLPCIFASLLSSAIHTTLPSYISFSLGWFCLLPPVHSSSGTLFTRSDPLNKAMRHAVQGQPRQTGHTGELWQDVVHWRRDGKPLLYTCRENPMNSVKSLA